MLQNIRNNIQGTAAKVIIAIIVVPFAFFGIDSLFQSGGPKAVAEINGTEISEAELAQAVAMQKRRLIGMMGDQIDPGMLDDSVLRGPALNTLVKQALMLDTAESANVVVSNEQLNATIAAMPQFQESGRFSQARYEQMLRLQGYSGALFKDLLRSDLVIQQLSNGLAGSAFVTDAQLARVVEVLHETRDYQYIPVPISNFTASVTVTDDEIAAYYESAKDEFQSEEKVRLSYLELNESQFFKPVSEDQVQAEYQRMVSGLEKDTEREAAHILVEITDDRSREDGAKLLKEIKAKLADGASFDEMAAKYSEDAGSANQGGVLGFTAGDSFPSEFEDALATLEPGAVSGVVETDAGLHLIKLVSLRQPEVPSFDSVRGEITERLREQKARPELIAKVEELKDLAFNAESLAMPAKQLGLEVKQTDWLSRTDEADIFSSDLIRQAAFDATLREQNLNSDVVEVSPTKYVVIHVEEYAAPQPLPLADVKEEIVAALTSEKARQAAKEKADALAAKLAKGERAEDLAKAEGLKWEAVVAGKRNSTSVASAIRNKAFAVSRPAEDSVSTAIAQNDDSFVAIQVTGVTQGDLDRLDVASATESKKSMYEQQMGQDFSAYFNSLWSNADITIRK
ncbi:SurA N-terminal domain-containing protein [Spongiibacter taiwanensis]|uniref:SurA N-terminal domain-containing protein n=1 Tax=Spongiibacter taiwanensis TaxID=1748242 RepID=UPI002034EF47|nr:SurA N-terminal domain-containing protein [Spongiibacter taiwanensis]USA43398.1 SurA N-terminal domain-containing protein [Spongiibacter taiwanensis]